MEAKNANTGGEKQHIDLSTIRTALALDRTLLASIRTSLTLSGFGFTLAKFVHDLIDKGMLHGVDPAYPRQVGFALMGLGLATLAGGIFEYVRIGKRVNSGASWSVTLAIALGLAVADIVLLASLAAELQVR
jgi:putative membrane protein